MHAIGRKRFDHLAQDGDQRRKMDRYRTGLRERLAVLWIHVVDVVQDHAGHTGLGEDVARESTRQRDVQAVGSEPFVHDALALAGRNAGMDVGGEEIEDVVVTVLI